MPNREPNFLAARLQLKRSASLATIQWPRPDAVSVSVRLGAEGRGEAFEKSWRGVPRDHLRAQAAVGVARHVQNPGGGDFQLEISEGDKPVAQLAWSPATESEPLRQVRTLLETISHLHYAEALTFLDRGRGLASSRKPAAGIEAFQTGIETLGDRYADPGLIDDTDAKLILAEHNRNTGKLAEAAALFERVLESRTQAYFERFLRKK